MKRLLLLFISICLTHIAIGQSQNNIKVENLTGCTIFIELIVSQEVPIGDKTCNPIEYSNLIVIPPSTVVNYSIGGSYPLPPGITPPASGMIKYFLEGVMHSTYVGAACLSSDRIGSPCAISQSSVNFSFYNTSCLLCGTALAEWIIADATHIIYRFT